MPTRVIVVDDDPIVASSLTRTLTRETYEVVSFGDGESALTHLKGNKVDVVISDVSMPSMTGIELLQRVREAHIDVPVIFVTGTPRIEDAMRAIEYGAFRYLTKPIAREQLLAVVKEARGWRRLTQAATEAATNDREELEAAFRRATGSLRVVYQPIVVPGQTKAFGYEALMRSGEPALPSPPAVLEAAEKLGSLHALGRQIRSMVAAQAALEPFDHVFFVNLHSADLADPELYETASPLSRHARSVVLELTERASLEGIGEVEKRLSSLREMGYRLAVDDMGAGYAGLSYFARVRPDIVKIDMSLTRNVDRDEVKHRVVKSMCDLAGSLEILVVAEGIETRGELDCVRDLGVHYVQGYALAKPGPPYPIVGG